MTGEAGPAGVHADRAVVERYFVSNAFAFFVGWVWLVSSRDLLGVVQRQWEGAVLQLDAAYGWQRPSRFGDFLVAVLWAPLLTFFMFWMQNRAVEAIATNSGHDHARARLRWKRGVAKISFSAAIKASAASRAIAEKAQAGGATKTELV